MASYLTQLEYTKLGRIMRIMQKERNTTNFGRANNRLSMACSEIVKGVFELAESYHYDSMFDGGEFSGPAYGRALQDLYTHVASKYHYGTVEALQGAVKRVTNGKVAYELFYHYTPQEV